MIQSLRKKEKHINQGGQRRFNLPEKVVPDVDFTDEPVVQLDVLPV